jgi:hypothetical protein
LFRFPQSRSAVGQVAGSHRIPLHIARLEPAPGRLISSHRLAPSVLAQRVLSKGFSARVPTKLFHQQTSALEFFPAHAGFVFQCRLSRSDFLGRCSHLVSVSRDSFPHMIPVFVVVSRSWILRLGVSWHR